MTKNKNLPPTLADAAMRQSFKKPPAVPPALAAKIAKARRFVLDAGAAGAGVPALRPERCTVGQVAR
jgi:hypothetical protein